MKPPILLLSRRYTLPLWFAVAGMLLNCHVMAQSVTKEYKYTKQTINKEKLEVFAGTDTLTIFPYQIAAHKKTRVAPVRYGVEDLKIVSVSEPNVLSIQKVDGSLLATILYEKGKLNDVVIGNNQFDWVNGKSKNDWQYTLQGKEVISCKLVKVDGKQTLQHTITDTSFPEMYLLEIASAQVALTRIKQQSNAPVFVGIAVGLALIRVAMTSDNSPDVQ